MTEQEKINAEVQIRLTKQDAKFELMLNELKEQREDIRRLSEKHDADVKDLLKQINATWRQTMIGVGGMIVVLGVLLIAVLK
ncbi:MAG: hypothetical protein SR1Q5_03250 [Quinella sp. 1Q5]|nr:hypothetical protein [Quinella sp. 1Q5]